MKSVNWKFVMFFSIFFVLYGLINYYIGLRGWQALRSLSISSAWVWTTAVIIGSLAFPLGRFVADFLPHDVSKTIIYIGSYWMGAMFYLFLIFSIFDLLRVINHWTGILPITMRGYFSTATLVVLGLVAIILIYGTWNSLHPVVRNYEITLDKKSSSLDSMRIVMVSDIHLGWIVGIDRIKNMTSIINSLEPDLILLPGDIVDEGVDLEAEQELPEVLQNLHPRLGAFAAMGNHEYISGNADTVTGFLKRAGITVLRDEWVEIADKLYIAGRDDASRSHYSGGRRKDLSGLLEDMDKEKLPIILMDHEPFNLNEPEKAGVDLQVSGHTHLGQIYPNNYITNAVYENDWGYLRKGSLQTIVSCGFGTWGPPIRIGNRPEVVNILVKFSN